MSQALQRLAGRFAQIWWGLRQVTGDAAYERYVERVRGRPACGECGGAAGVLSREEFYLDMLRRRYSGVSRCC